MRESIDTAIQFKLLERPKMKAWKGNYKKYCHLKLDGHFTYLVKSSTGVPAAFSRKPIDITDQVRGRDFWDQFVKRAPAGICVMGELWHPEKNASFIKTALVNNYPLHYRGFAISTMPAEMPLEEVNHYLSLYGVQTIPFSLYDGETFTDPHGLNIEGYVFKDGNLLGWERHKPKSTIDCVITRCNRGTGGNVFTLGSVSVAVLDGTDWKEIANVSGFTEEERDYIWKQQANMIGKVIEVEYQRVDTLKRLRHPTFIRFRDDKNSNECVIEQEPELL